MYLYLYVFGWALLLREDFSFKLIKHSAAMDGSASVIGFGRNYRGCLCMDSAIEAAMNAMQWNCEQGGCSHLQAMHCECKCNVTWRKCREQIVPRCRPLLTFSCSGSTLILKCRSAVISYHTNLFALSTCIERVNSLFRIEKEYIISNGWWHLLRCITTWRSQPNTSLDNGLVPGG